MQNKCRVYELMVYQTYKQIRHFSLMVHKAIDYHLM